LTGIIAYASIPDQNGVIHGCYNTARGTLRVIDTATQTCNAGAETAVQWNQTGQVGPIGPTGPVGPTGLQGSPGESGLPHVYFASGRGTVVNNVGCVPGPGCGEVFFELAPPVNLPTGSYVAQAQITAAGGDPVKCTIENTVRTVFPVTDPDAPLGTSYTPVGTVTMTSAFNLPNGGVPSLLCEPSNLNNQTAATTVEAELLVTQVASAN
jgi:hypothetical protein